MLNLKYSTQAVLTLQYRNCKKSERNFKWLISPDRLFRKTHNLHLALHCCFVQPLIYSVSRSFILIRTRSTVALPSRARTATIQMTTLSGSEVMMSSQGLKSSGVGVQTTVVGCVQNFWKQSFDLTHTVGS